DCQLFGAITGIGDDYFIAIGVSVIFERAEDVEEEWVLHVGRDHTQRPALTSGQRLSVNVRIILEFGYGFQDTRSGRAFDTDRIVEYARYRGSRNTCKLSNFLQTHRNEPST